MSGPAAVLLAFNKHNIAMATRSSGWVTCFCSNRHGGGGRHRQHGRRPAALDHNKCLILVFWPSSSKVSPHPPIPCVLTGFISETIRLRHVSWTRPRLCFSSRLFSSLYLFLIFSTDSRLRLNLHFSLFICSSSADESVIINK